MTNFLINIIKKKKETRKEKWVQVHKFRVWSELGKKTTEQISDQTKPNQTILMDYVDRVFQFLQENVKL